MAWKALDQAKVMSKHNSTRTILSATAILGSASVVTLFLSLIRTKAFALLLGPSGVGLLGLVNNVLTSGAIIAGLGLSTSGGRKLSEAGARGDLHSIGWYRTVLRTSYMLLGITSLVLLWLFQKPISIHLLGNEANAPLVFWIGVGVVFSLAASVQIATVLALRRLSDYARIQIVSAFLATVVGVGAIWLWGQQALMVFVLAVPLLSLLVASWFVSRLRIPSVRLGARDIASHGSRLAKLGILFMAAQFVISGGLLAVRARIEWHYGIEAVGHFEAAWLLSSVYLSAVLSTMTTDYLSRQSGLVHDDPATAALINDQTRVALWLCGPICVVLIGLAPLAIYLLFSSKFAVAADILRWQVAGDIMKVMAWPLGGALIARGDGKGYLVLESTAILAFVGAVWWLLPSFGLIATGFGVLIMYCVYLPLGRALVRRHVNFEWDRSVISDALISLAAALATALAATLNPVAGGGLGILLGGILAFGSWRRLQELVGKDGWRTIFRQSAQTFDGPSQ